MNSDDFVKSVVHSKLTKSGTGWPNKNVPAMSLESRFSYVDCCIEPGPQEAHLDIFIRAHLVSIHPNIKWKLMEITCSLFHKMLEL